MTEATTEKTALETNTGATPADLSDGQGTGGAPKQPVDQAEAKAIADKAASDKAKADAEAAERAKSGEDDDAPKVTKTPEELAAEAAAAEAAKDEPAEGDADWRTDYIAFDDPSAQAAVNLLKEAKVPVVTANAIFAEAVKTGNVELVDWKSLESLIGADKTVLVKAGTVAYFNGTLAENRAIVTETYEQLGGEANWITLKTWAQGQEKNDKTGNFGKKLNDYRKMIDGGGEGRRLAIVELKAAFDADPATKGFGTAKITEGTQPATGDAPPITRQEYNKALHEAERNKSPHHVYVKLKAQRRAGMAAGI
jgi:hypothetical protein